MKLTKPRIILIALSGAVIFLVVATLLLSGPHMRNQPSLRAFEQVTQLPPENSIFYTPDVTSPEIETLHITGAAAVERGKVYYEYYCQFCHGISGNGEGPVGRSYNPKPADLTLPMLRQYSADTLYEKSFSGLGHDPVLQRVVPFAQRKYILAYLNDRFIDHP